MIHLDCSVIFDCQLSSPAKVWTIQSKTQKVIKERIARFSWSSRMRFFFVHSELRKKQDYRDCWSHQSCCLDWRRGFLFVDAALSPVSFYAALHENACPTLFESL